MNIIHLEKDNFKDLIKNKVLVDFYANWCGPCKMLAPVLEKVDSTLDVIKVDVDVYDDIAREYGVMSIPTLILFEDGKPIKKNIGFIDKKRIEDMINNK